jgi:rod shape-determining protein MreC
LLLLLPLGTYVANAKQARELSAIDKLCLAASSPISRAVDWAFGGAADLWTAYVALRGADEENERLRQTVAELRERLVGGDEAEHENARLRSLLELAPLERGRTAAARVIGVSPTQRRSIFIGIGKDDGVREGMPVITAGGVVGKVGTAFGSSSEVQLVVDVGSAVAGRMQRSRARVTVRGKGSESHMELANALRTDDIEEGDLIVTSGTDRVFPKGLVIGRVGRLDRRPYGMYVEGEVLPAVDPSGLEEVLVIVAPEEGARDLPTAGAEPSEVPVLLGAP